ncbi:MAG TPA: hypothetical protein VFU86_16990, partial [Terriglobales bacterium]|nr:hypothetical protein [Terriglobales bacterium]
GQKVTPTRDVSARSVCFYLHDPLPEASTIDFMMELPREITLTQGIRMQCSGSIVRVECGSPDEWDRRRRND